MTQEISASPRVAQTRQGDAIPISRRIDGEATLLHADAADFEAQVARKAAARTESAALSAQLAVGAVASEVAAAKVMITAGLSGDAPLTFRGNWDASTNTPDLLASDPREGDLWIVSKAGTTEIGGQKEWDTGDAAWYHNGAWAYFARAGWAAVAQTITAISAIKAGSSEIRTPGSQKWAVAWVGATGQVLGGILRDGTPQFSSDDALFGPLRVERDPRNGEGTILIDAARTRSLHATNAVHAGQARIGTAGSDRWLAAWLDTMGAVMGGIERDGSPLFPGARARIGPVQIEQETLLGTGVITLDQSGAVIANGSDLTFPGAHSPARGRIAENVARRAPGYRDDERCGFRAGDLWQADRTLYACLESSAEGAIWDLAPDGAGACPGDVFGSDLAGAWGVDAMIVGYTGPAFDVTTIAGGARQVTTIRILPGGRHDADALARVLVMRDAGSSAEITTLYDQSGQNHPLTGAYGNAPRIGAVTVNGHAAISFDASGAKQRRALANAGISVPSSSFTALAFGKWTATNSALNENIQLLTMGTFSTISGIDEDGRLGVYDGKAFFKGTSRQKCNPGMAGLSAAGGVVSVWSGERSDRVAVYPTALKGNATGFTLGAMGVGQSCNGVLTGVVLARRAATETDFSRAYRSGALRWDWTPQARPRLWAIGDSRTAGYLSENGLTWPTMIDDYLDQPMTVINLGVSGAKTVDFISMTLPGVQDDLARDPDAYNLAVIWLGINDFAGGRSKDVTMQNIRKIVAALLEGGVRHVWVISEVFANDQEWFWQYLPNGENPDLTLVAPFLAGAPLSPFGKTGVDTIVWHPDGIHPRPSAGRVLASTLTDSINAFNARDLDR